MKILLKIHKKFCHTNRLNKTKSGQPSTIIFDLATITESYIFRYASVSAYRKLFPEFSVSAKSVASLRPSARRESETGFARLPYSGEFVRKAKASPQSGEDRTPQACGVSAAGGNLLPPAQELASAEPNTRICVCLAITAPGETMGASGRDLRSGRGLSRAVTDPYRKK